MRQVKTNVFDERHLILIVATASGLIATAIRIMIYTKNNTTSSPIVWITWLLAAISLAIILFNFSRVPAFSEMEPEDWIPFVAVICAQVAFGITGSRLFSWLLAVATGSLFASQLWQDQEADTAFANSFVFVFHVFVLPHLAD